MQLEIIDKLFLPMLFFIGFVTSWEDFHFGKIRNKWIILGIIFSVAVLVGLAVYNLITGSFYIIPWDYFWKVPLNSFFALLVGFFLWKYGMMAAGDAKLFFVFSLLLPLKYYWKSYLSYFPSFVLLVNIFLPVLFFIFIKAVFYVIKSFSKFIKNKPFIKIDKLINKLKKEIFKTIKLFTVFIVIFILIKNLWNFISHWLAAYLPNQGFLFLIFILLYGPLSSFLKKNKIIFTLTFLVFIVYLAGGLIYAPQVILVSLVETLKILIFFFGLLWFLRVLLDYYLNNAGVKKIKIAELRPGMNLVIDDQKNKKPKLGNIFGGGLTYSQVMSVKVWAAKKNIKEIEIYQRFPFAYWMFLGVIITIILKGSLITSIF